MTGLRDPWVLLLAAFGGGATWAFGTSVPLAASTAVVMLATAAAVAAMTHRGSTPEPQRDTEQARLVRALDGHLRSLDGLRGETLPPLVQSSAADAWAAADGARASATRVAAAADDLDAAIFAARRVIGHGPAARRAIEESVGRLRGRRGELLDRLASVVDEVATVYTRLLEMSATARTMAVAVDSSAFATVNDSVVLLRLALSELEADPSVAR